MTDFQVQEPDADDVPRVWWRVGEQIGRVICKVEGITTFAYISQRTGLPFCASCDCKRRGVPLENPMGFGVLQQISSDGLRTDSNIY